MRIFSIFKGKYWLWFLSTRASSTFFLARTGVNHLKKNIQRLSSKNAFKYCPRLSNCCFFCRGNLPGYPDTLNPTLKNKARLSRAFRDIEGHFKGVSSAIVEQKPRKNAFLSQWFSSKWINFFLSTSSQNGLYIIGHGEHYFRMYDFGLHIFSEPQSFSKIKVID